MITAFLACTAHEPPAHPEPPPPRPTHAGDAEAGARAIQDGEYIQCGVPEEWAPLVFGTDPEYLVEGRTEANADLPYYLSTYTTDSGLVLATTNCLYCHADHAFGEVRLGLGNDDLSFAYSLADYVSVLPALATSEEERVELTRFAARLEASSPYTVTDTVGVNPADTLAQALFRHRDPDTLEWTEVPLLDPPDPPIPTDVPPLWNLKKKERMLHTGAGTGNLARIMMTASVLCTESDEDADAIYPMFEDIRAWMATIEPPAYPDPVDADLAAEGQEVFERTCSICHGTYGEDWSYPNQVIPLHEVGTDGLMVELASTTAAPYTEWFNGSWYGQDAELVVPDGYMAPPLDGIWATAPYFHNGSVPTLEGVLDPSLRPTYWHHLYDYVTAGPIGVLHSEEGGGRDVIDEPTLYDTTRPGYGNGGHLFGEELTEAERAAVIEYLKTL